MGLASGQRRRPHQVTRSNGGVPVNLHFKIPRLYVKPVTGIQACFDAVLELFQRGGRPQSSVGLAIGLWADVPIQYHHNG